MKLSVIPALLSIPLMTLVGCGGGGGTINKDYFALQIEATNDRDISDSRIQNAVQTPDGGIITVGRFENNLWVMKFDRDNNVIWQNTYSEAFWNDKGLYVLDDGAYAIVGSRRSDTFLIVLEPNGAVRSLEYYTDLRTDDSMMDDDGIYIMGESNGGAVLLKVDYAGNLIHSNFYNSLTELTELVELPNGEMVLAGERGNRFNDNGRVDLVLLKTDAQGELIDSVVYGNHDTGVYTAGLFLDDNQRVVLGGYTEFGAYDVHNPIKLVINQDLSIASSQQYTFYKVASIADLIPTSDGGMLMTGQIGQSNNDWTQVHSALIKTDRSGDIQWAKRYEFVPSFESGARSVVESDRGYFMSGDFNDNDGWYGFVISTDYSGGVEGSGLDISNISNGTVSSFSLIRYDDQDIFWQSYGQGAVFGAASAAPSTSVVTRR